MKKILVAGAGGFIAGELAKALKKQGNEIVAVDKKPLTEWYQITEGVTNFVLDLQYRENCYTAVNGFLSTATISCPCSFSFFVSSPAINPPAPVTSIFFIPYSFILQYLFYAIPQGEKRTSTPTQKIPRAINAY